MIPLIIVGAIVALLLFFAVGLYNSFVRSKIKVDEAWADIDTFLKQRSDMIPNLVNTVKGYMKHESDTFKKVTELRSAIQNASTNEEMAKADNMLSSTLKTLFAVAENYPELKANENFLSLQAEIQQIEDDLQKSRRYYNGAVRDYNTKLQVFPGNLFAGIFGFSTREFFKVADADRENVEVDFSDK